MKTLLTTLLLAAIMIAGDALAKLPQPDTSLDILVTLQSSSAAPVSGGMDAPYRKRKRYATAVDVQLLAAEIANDFAIVEISRWPIRSLSVLCIVYRVADETTRDSIIERLQKDPRVDSAQRLQRFDTLAAADYDDTLVGLQRGLDVMGIREAHRYAKGRGVNIVVVDSAADPQHEDLAGRIGSVRVFTDSRQAANGGEHGTAVVSLIAANANNARGIVGVAPEASIDLFVACWPEAESAQAVCDSFTLAKAFDALVDSKAQIVNLSLAGPYDPLLDRLLEEVSANGALIVAARPAADRQQLHFPASRAGVISVQSGDLPHAVMQVAMRDNGAVRDLHAPGERIVVALPDNQYDFRSGSSLAAAHISGVAALLLSASPSASLAAIESALRHSERRADNGLLSVHACEAMRVSDASRVCQ
jgi:subtilisin family serine protease